MARDQNTSPEIETRPKKVSVFIKLFVLFHLIAITSWCLPGPPARDKNRRAVTVLQKMRRAGESLSDGTLKVNQDYVKTSPVKYYLLFSGFWQYWDMFSPNPASVDFYGTAEITYRDGTVRAYEFPRMYSMSIPEKYVSERYRKFYERAHVEKLGEGGGAIDNSTFLWPIFAQRVALTNYDNPLNPPVKVVLTRNFMRIAPPGKPPATEYTHYNYYTYDVDLVRLDSDKAKGFFG